MRRASAVGRVLALTALIAVIVGSIASPVPHARAATGALEIRLLDSGGAGALAGGCYFVQDAEGAESTLCDPDGAGVVVTGLAEGPVTVLQTAQPATHAGGASG